MASLGIAWALVALCRPGALASGNSMPGWPWLLALAMFGAHWVLDAWRGGLPIGVHMPTTLPYWPWLAVPVFFAWRRSPLSPGALWLGVAFAAALAGGMTLYLWGVGAHVRVRLSMNAIPFGNLSLCFGVLALMAALFWRTGTPCRALCWLAAVLGLVASLLSGTRGGWITLPVVVLILARWRGGALWRDWSARSVSFRVAGWLAFMALAGFALSRMWPRAEDLISDLHRYAADGNTRTSVGLRLDMWSAAWTLFLQKPWLGWGEHGLMLEMQRWIMTGQLNEQAQYFGYQLHSDVLDTLARRGLLGLATLLPMYLVPGWLFMRALRRGGEDQGVAMAGLLTVVMFAGFGLTQSQFRDPHTFAAYLVLISAMVAMVGQSRLLT